MRLNLIAGAALVAALSVSLSGCAGMPGIGGGASTKDFLQHIESCKRHYTGTIGATGVNGSLDIDCQPVGTGLSTGVVAGGSAAP